MTQQNNEAFEKWNSISNDDAYNYTTVIEAKQIAYQAAKADSEREIAELKEINLELQFQINLILNSESLEQAVRPAIKWLCENKHPHSKIIIDSSSYELVDGIEAGIIQTYIKD